MFEIRASYVSSCFILAYCSRKALGLWQLVEIWPVSFIILSTIPLSLLCMYSSLAYPLLLLVTPRLSDVLLSSRSCHLGLNHSLLTLFVHALGTISPKILRTHPIHPTACNRRRIYLFDLPDHTPNRHSFFSSAQTPDYPHNLQFGVPSQNRSHALTVYFIIK